MTTFSTATEVRRRTPSLFEAEPLAATAAEESRADGGAATGKA